MRQEISLSRPGERAQAKAKLLVAAVKRLADDGVQMDIFAVFAHLAPHVMKRDHLNPQLEIDQARAQATVAVTLNLALDVATKGDVQKAANALKKNPLEKIFAIGERTVQELQQRVIAVSESAIINTWDVAKHKGKNSTGVYGVCSVEIESLLKKWGEGELSDHPMLPPASREEIKVITDVLDQVERETALASKVAWGRILSPSLDLFASRYFKRSKAGVPTPAGGIWKPFLLSLLIRAMGQEWGVPVMGGEKPQFVLAEKYVIVTPHVLKPFLDLVMFEPEKIPERVDMAVQRLTGSEIVATKIKIDGPRGAMLVGQREAIFAAKLSEEEYNQLLALCQPLLNQFIEDTRSFYMKHVKDIDAPTGTELDEFWRTRLFVHGIADSVGTRIALAEALIKEPWKKIPEATTLHAVAKLLKGWSAWPAEHQEAFLKGGDGNRILDATKSSSHQAEQVVTLWKELEGVISYGELDVLNTMWIDWGDRQKLIVALIECKGTEYPELLRGAIKNVKWTPASAASVLLGDSSYFSSSAQFYPSALVSMRDQMSPDDWRSMLGRLQEAQGNIVRPIWENMTPEERCTHLYQFNPLTLSIVLRDQPLEEVKAFFTPVLEACAADTVKANEFLHWYLGHPPWQYAFILDTEKVVGGLTVDQRFRDWMNQRLDHKPDIVKTKSGKRYQV